MKIQCDVCTSAEASVFCCADEAALCDPCDRRVHRANKLAGKHRRFSLSSSSSPTPSSLPLCDICQDKRGFVFCQEDRAIMCWDCDAPIHTTNTHTMKHNRFLITGVRLSSAPIPTSSSSPPDTETEVTSCTTTPSTTTTTITSYAAVTTTATNDSSSISEYLTKMLPGWHVEDFLTDESSTTAGVAGGFCQEDELSPFLEAGELPPWVPPIPPVNHPGPDAAASGGNFYPGPGLGRSNQHRLKASRRRRSEDAYAVPQIHHECGGIKRSRPSIWYFDNKF